MARAVSRLAFRARTWSSIAGRWEGSGVVVGACRALPADRAGPAAGLHVRRLVAVPPRDRNGPHLVGCRRADGPEGPGAVDGEQPQRVDRLALHLLRDLVIDSRCVSRPVVHEGLQDVERDPGIGVALAEGYLYSTLRNAWS